MKWLAHTKSILGRGRHARRGQSLVEFAMVAPLFFLLVFGITDFGRLFFTQETLQHAVREAGRFAVTGQHLPDSNNPGKNLSRVDSIIQTAKKAAAGLDVKNVTISSPQGGVPRPAGGPGETVVISLTTELKLITPVIGNFFPNGKYVFTVSTTFKNEPFDPSDTL